MKIRKMKYEKKVDECAEIGAGYRWLFEWIKPSLNRKKVLNVGCWTGVLEKLLINANCILTGIDIEEEALKAAREEFPQYTFVKASITESLPFKKNTFDVVLYFMTIEHLPKGTELESLRNINRVMRKNGKMYFSTMNNNLLSNLFDPLYLFGHKHYRVKDLELMLKKTGFKISELKINGGFVMIMYTFLFYFYKHVLHKTFYSKKIDNWMKQEYNRKGFAEIKIMAEKMKEI